MRTLGVGGFVGVGGEHIVESNVAELLQKPLQDMR